MTTRSETSPSKTVLRIARGLRKDLVQQVTSCGTKRVGIPLSGGVDSHCALFAALEAGLRPKVFSFHLEGVVSRDLRTAQSTCAEFDLQLIPVTLPTDPAVLKRDVFAMARMGAVSKTDFECFWPMYYLIPAMQREGVRAFFTGHGADSLYCMSRKANQHYKGRADVFREEAFSSTRAFQQTLIREHCKKSGGLKYVPIFYNDRVLSLFKGSDPADLRKPAEKAPSRLAFADYFERVRVFGHQSFQLGDTGISDHFQQLLDDPALNPGNKYKSVAAVYRRISVNGSWQKARGLFA